MVQRRRVEQKLGSGSMSNLVPLNLTPHERAELNWLAQEVPGAIARRARVILLWARGESISAIAQRLKVHRSTVRRWVQRFVHERIAGLARDERGVGRHQQRIESNVRDAIVRAALSHPAALGESFETWSLRKLQQHIMRRGLVKHLSVEGLRQILRGVPLPPELWRRERALPLRLTAEQRASLEQLLGSAKPDVARRARIVLARANGLQEAEIAAAVCVAPSSVRYWLRRFRVHGVLGIQAPRKPMKPTRFTPEIRRNILAVANTSPAECGLHRPQWSLRSLRAVLMQRGIVHSISIQHLRRILGQAGVQQPPVASAARHTSTAVS